MKKLLPPAIALVGLLGLAANSLAAEMSSEVKIDLPAETARLKPGPGMDTVGRNCMICHSVDYIYMQPPLTKEQWHGEVMKMKKVFGAPVPDNEVDTIVDYLMTQRGKK
jgi:cytochrome c5